MQIHCSTHSVILNVTATQYTCSLNSVYCPLQTTTVKSSLFTHAHSSPLSLASRLHQCHANCSHYINNSWATFVHIHTHAYMNTHIYTHIYTHSTFTLVFFGWSQLFFVHQNDFNRVPCLFTLFYFSTVLLIFLPLSHCLSGDMLGPFESLMVRLIPQGCTFLRMIVF